jgi:H+/Cl- antiporter ClcA
MNPGTGRLAFLSLLAVVIGLLGGAASWVLLKLIALLTNLALLHTIAWKLPSLANYHPQWWLIPTAMAGGLIVSLLAKWSPVIRGHGIPEAMEAVLTRESRIAPPTAIAKPTSAAVAIGTGGPFGAEGPIIVTGGALGSLIGQVLHVSPSERKILLAAGAAAGMAGVFGAPIASVVLAIELLLFEFSARAFVPLAISASIAGGVHVYYAGSGPLFPVPSHGFSGLSQLPVFVVLGLACGVLAVVICKGLYLTESAYRRLPVGQFWHPIIGAALFAIVGFMVPRALGVGYDVINDALASKIALGTLLAIMLGKTIAWWFALGSGTSGGTLAPLLIMGATFGGLFAAGVDHVVPGLHIAPVAIVLVAMAATFGAATKAIFTAIIFAFELTHDYQVILAMTLAVVVADLVSSALLDHGLMTEKLARRGLSVPRSYTPDFLAHTPVSVVMHMDDSITVGENAPTLAPTASLLDALVRMVELDLDNVPVTNSSGELLGVVTRTDILEARSRSMESEQIQRGWMSRFHRNGNVSTV